MAMLGLSLYALSFLDAAWWWYLLLALGPDISMIGYAGGNKTGATAYNLFHHKSVAVALFVTGLLLPHTGLQLIGIVLFGHSSMDRIFGYGLKTARGFTYTHLRMIGKK